MARNINRNAIFINLFYDFAPPEAVKVYQSFDATNGRALLRRTLDFRYGSKSTDGIKSV